MWILLVAAICALVYILYTYSLKSKDSALTSKKKEKEHFESEGVVGGDSSGNAMYESVAPSSEEQVHDRNLPADCFPKDQLDPKDLLPGNDSSTWAQSVPNAQGDLGDQNFLTAGYHVGVNTVGQSLRNANLQLRSEPANPQVKVSPWLQATIEPDTMRQPLEIGCKA